LKYVDRNVWGGQRLGEAGQHQREGCASSVPHVSEVKSRRARAQKEKKIRRVKGCTAASRHRARKTSWWGPRGKWRDSLTEKRR